MFPKMEQFVKLILVLLCLEIDKTTGGTLLEQGVSDGSGYVTMENEVLCGDFWDLNAATVACHELGLGKPKQVLGTQLFGTTSAQYSDFIPLCTGDEPKLASCKLEKNSGPCSKPAGLVCSRVTSDNETKILLDGLPVCLHDGFGNTEASALCKEGGFFNGEVNHSSSLISEISTGWNITCETENLQNCQKSVCTNGKSANISCSENPLQVKLLGGSIPGQGTVLYKGGLVCDDSWDLQDANVVCKELGYSGAYDSTTHSYFGPAETPLQITQGISLPYMADEVMCKGDEQSLSQCDYQVKSNCGVGEAAGVKCILEIEEKGKERRKKRSVAALAAAAPAVSQLAETGSNIVGSAIDYFEKKEQAKQQYLKERPDGVDLSSAGVEIKMTNEKGYMNLGGEFQSGGMDLKIQEIPKRNPNTESGGQAFTYPAGLGPMLMNGCFGTDYKIGDPCYAAKRMNTRCNDMMEAANFVGVGFDGTGAYNHASRRKSLIQRSCAGKSTYHGEDVPDTMNVFGIYDTSCSGQSFESMQARSQFQREQAKMGENEDYLGYNDGSHYGLSVGRSVGWFSASVHANAKYSSHSIKTTDSSESSRSNGGANAEDSKTVTGIFDFTCRVRLFEIYLDEVKPDQLSEAFLQDYMALPISYFDFRNKAPKKFSEFLARWGTHYIKSASFGGKFILLRESVISGRESKAEWQARMQESASALFEAKESSKSASFEAGGGIGWGGVSGGIDANINMASAQNSYTGGSASDESGSSESSRREENSFTKDDILVEGGHQRVAALLSDKNRAGFKAEFVEWLDSISEYPKGYDFKFGEISDLLDMNFHTLLNKDFKPCWEISNRQPNKDENENDITSYNVTVKDENGNEKEEMRNCNFDNLEDFQDKMDKKRLSLKHATTLFAKNRGRSWNKLTLPSGPVDCEQKTIEIEQIPYNTLLGGKTYKVVFDLLGPIGNKILQDAEILLRFVKDHDSSGMKGSWQVNRELSRRAGQIGKLTSATGNKVFVLGARFTYLTMTNGNYLTWTREDCEHNVRHFKNLQYIQCSFAQNDGEEANIEDGGQDGDIDWVDVPLATVTSLEPPKQFVPCNMDWSNYQMLMSEKSCVRFTAASRGPIYFGLSAIPNKPSTWYYFRISTDEVSVYKGDELLPQSTDANGAVGLGNENIFQAFIVCSEHDGVTTRLTYGKISADETISKNAKLQSYLMVEDEKSPINPSFYAFGSGEYKVQIVDIDVTDVPEAECRGDTYDLGSGNGCQISCKIEDIKPAFNQKSNISCYNSNDKLVEGKGYVGAGSYCIGECDWLLDKVIYPKDGKTSCQLNGDWSSKLGCSSLCSPATVLEEGSLLLNSKTTIRKVEINATCVDSTGKVITDKDYITEGSECSIGDSGSRLCGEDEEGFLYHVREKNSVLSCTADGAWKNRISADPIREPVCRAIPCSPLHIPGSTDVQCNGQNVKEPCCIQGPSRYIVGTKGQANGSGWPERHASVEACAQRCKDLKDCQAFHYYNVTEPSRRNCYMHKAGVIGPQLNDGVMRLAGVCPKTGLFNEGVTCELKKCLDTHAALQPDSATCSEGSWTNNLRCVPVNETCPSQPATTHGSLDCSQAGRDPESQEFLGGSVCRLTCDEGYVTQEDLQQGDAQCVGGQWENTACEQDTRCKRGEEDISNGYIGYCAGHDSNYVVSGTKCKLYCNSGYKVVGPDQADQVTCELTKWVTKGSCDHKPVDGIWGDWKPWGACNQQTGERERTRECNNPAPQHGGLECPGDSTHKETCKVDGGWGSWGSWGACDPLTGKRKRTRKCNNPEKLNGGSDCAGDSEEKHNCKVDGGWGDWKSWGECNQQTGIKERTRECNNPPKQNGGLPCPGFPTEKDTCPVNGGWGSWGSWGACNKQTEKKERTRECNNPKRLNGGSDCAGDRVEERNCKVCDHGWLLFEDDFQAHCYVAVPALGASQGIGIDFMEAEKVCTQGGSHLASIHSAKEQKFVQDNFPANIWLGGTDITTEGRWWWLDGTEWDFEDWDSGQPDNAAGVQHCLVGNSFDDRKWDDFHCQLGQLNFLCKK